MNNHAQAMARAERDLRLPLDGMSRQRFQAEALGDRRRHEALTPRERAMMDELTVTALSAPAPEVQGFGLAAVPTLTATFSSPTLLAQPFYYYRQVSSLLETAR